MPNSHPRSEAIIASVSEKTAPATARIQRRDLRDVLTKLKEERRSSARYSPAQAANNKHKDETKISTGYLRFLCRRLKLERD